MQKSEEERDSDYQPDKIEKVKERFKYYLKNYDPVFEKAFLNKMFCDALKFTGKSVLHTIDENIEPDHSISSIDNLSQKILGSKIFSEKYAELLFTGSPEKLPVINDSAFEFFKRLENEYDLIVHESDKIDGSLTKLSAELTEVKRLWKNTSFIPDANGTLRLTYGYIKGYSPADAMYYSPVTTLEGVIDKSYTGGEYTIPKKLKDLYDAKDFGRFKDERLGSVPVAILYNMDTTGGNSGSPIMNAYGELIGVNFDRAYEATINDFAWNESYSRSIGVDIRYVLWLTQKFAGADFLLKEMGVAL